MFFLNSPGGNCGGSFILFIVDSSLDELLSLSSEVLTESDDLTIFSGGILGRLSSLDFDFFSGGVLGFLFKFKYFFKAISLSEIFSEFKMLKFFWLYNFLICF